MATRFYLPIRNNAATVPELNLVAFDAGWVTTSAIRSSTDIVKAATPLAAVAAMSETSTSVHNFAKQQFLSRPLAAQTISGTFSAVVKGVEDNVAADAYLQVVIRLVDAECVHKAFLYAGDTAAVVATVGAATEEWPTTAATRIKNALALTSQTAVAGDRLVIEIGTRFTNVSGTARTSTLNFGDNNAVDFALTSGLTTTLNPWVELSQTLVFQSPVIPDGADASTPAAVKGATANLTTASFTPLAGSLVEVVLVADETAFSAASISNTGTAITWTKHVERGTGSPGGALVGQVCLWSGVAPGGAITVTVGNGAALQKMLVVTVWPAGSYDTSTPVHVHSGYNATLGGGGNWNLTVTPVTNGRCRMATSITTDGVGLAGTVAVPTALLQERSIQSSWAGSLTYLKAAMTAGVNTNARTYGAAAVTQGNALLYEILASSVTVVSGAADLAAGASLSATGVRTAVALAALSAGAALTAAGVRTAVASAALSASATLATTGVVSKLGSADLGASAVLATTGVRAAAGAAAFVASATLIPVEVVTRFGSAALSASASLSAAGFLGQFGTAALSASASLAVAGIVTRPGAAALSAGASLAVAGIVTRLGTAALTAGAALTASGVVTRQGVADLAASSTLAATGIVTRLGVAALSADAQLAVSGSVIGPASAALSAGAALTVAEVVTRFGGAALSAVAVLGAPGVVSKLGSAALVGSAALAVSGYRTQFGSADLTAAAALGVGVTVVRVASAAMSGSAVLSVAVIVVRPAVADLTAAATLTAVGIVAGQVSAQLTAGAVLAVTGQRTTVAGVALVAVAVLAAAALGETAGVASLVGSGQLSASAVVTRPAVVALVGSGALTVAGFRVAFGGAALVGTGTLTVAGIRAVIGATTLVAAASLEAESAGGLAGAAVLAAVAILGTAGSVRTPGLVGVLSGTFRSDGGGRSEFLPDGGGRTEFRPGCSLGLTVRRGGPR